MTIPRNDFARSRPSIWSDPDAAYEMLRDQRDDDDGTPEPELSKEVALRLAREEDQPIINNARCPECDAEKGSPCFPNGSGTHYNRARLFARGRTS